MQGCLHACSRLLAAPEADADSERTHVGSASAVAAVAPRVTYATTLALAALERLGASAPPATLAEALPLRDAVAVAARVSRPGVPRARQAALQVITLALKGAELEDIKSMLPEILSLVLSGGRKV